MSEINDLLNSREVRYGDFRVVAETAQELKKILRRAPGNAREHEALDMIATKLARLVCGAAGQRDTWMDIAGYALLAAGAHNPHRRR